MIQGCATLALSRRARALLAAFVVLVSAAPLSSCGGSSSGASDPAAEVARANERLKGRWVLVGFRPDVALEPMLGQLLAFQIGRLTVDVDGARMFATGVGVQATRTYRIVEVDGDRLKLTLYDESGVPYDVRGELSGDLFRFEARTSPWNGSGVLQRSR